MKKLLIIPIITLLVSCASYSPVTNFVDYSNYSRFGFFLTESNSVNFSYTPVGSIQVILYSHYKKTEPAPKKETMGEDAIYSSSSKSITYKNATAQEAIGIAIEQAKEKGANAIINLKYEYIPAYKNAPYGWFVSGMAIEKK